MVASPFLRSPKHGTLVAVKADHERCNRTMFEDWQRLERIYPPENTLQAERPDHFPIHRHLIDIEAYGFMAEPLADVEKIACARTDVENMLPSAPIEIEFLHPSQINADPSVQVEVLPPTTARIFYGVTVINRLE